MDRGAPELLARPPRSARDVERVRGGQGAHLREPDGRRTGPCSTPTTRRSLAAGARRAVARRLSFSMSDVAADGRRRSRGDADRAAHGRRRASRWCRSRPYGCSAGTCWPTSLAAAAVASLAGVDAGGDDAARSKASPASSTRSSRWPRSAACGSSTTRRRPTSRRRAARSRASTRPRRDHGRPVQGRRLRRPARRRWPQRGDGGRRDRRGHAADPRGARRRRRRSTTRPT